MGRTKRNRCQRKRMAAFRTQPIMSHDYLPELYKYLNMFGWKNDTSLSVKDFVQTGRGLCSKERSFKTGDQLIQMPLKCFITVSTMGADSTFCSLLKLQDLGKDRRVSFQSLMALYVVFQKHLADNSPMSAYIRSLPDQLGVPCFCTQNELLCLPDVIIKKAVIQHCELRADFLKLQAQLREGSCTCCNKNLTEIYTLDLFKWAYFVINTRSVFLNSSLFAPKKCAFENIIAGKTDLALAPFLDLFNHSDTVQTTAELVLNDKKEFQYVVALSETTEKIKRYSQVFISYGFHTNLNLFLEYGFVPYNNTHDYFKFTLTDIENFVRIENVGVELLHRNKFKFIRDNNLDDEMFVHVDTGVSHNLRVVLHLILKVYTHFPNVLSQIAFGSIDNLAEGSHESVRLSILKIGEYQSYMRDLENMPELSVSGKVALAYLRNCTFYLLRYINDPPVN